MLDLSEKIAIVTGGGSGIGQAISQKLAEHGAKVHIFERDKVGAAATVQASISTWRGVNRGGSMAPVVPNSACSTP